jgi:hypothetical protein
MMIYVEKSVELLAGESEVPGEKPAAVPLYPPQIPYDLRSNPGRRGGKKRINRLSYGKVTYHSNSTVG